MYSLRGTQKLFSPKHHTHPDPTTILPAPTTALGDWYAHRLVVERQHIAMCVSSRSRLCVLTPARDIDNLSQRLYYTLVDLLRLLDLPEEAIAQERREMADVVVYGPTTGTPEGRSVLGTINDYSRALRYTGLEGRDLEAWNLHFSRWICGPLGHERPVEATARLLDEALHYSTLSSE